MLKPKKEKKRQKELPQTTPDKKTDNISPPYAFLHLLSRFPFFPNQTGGFNAPPRFLPATRPLGVSSHSSRFSNRPAAKEHRTSPTSACRPVPFRQRARSVSRPIHLVFSNRSATREHRTSPTSARRPVPFQLRAHCLITSGSLFPINQQQKNTAPAQLQHAIRFPSSYAPSSFLPTRQEQKPITLFLFFCNQPSVFLNQAASCHLFRLF